MEIPQGYKWTELGVIPEEWEVKQISEFTSIVTGGTPNTLHAEYWGGDILWMNSGELNYKFIYNVVGRVTCLGLQNSSTHILPAQCVLIGLAGQGKTRGTAAYNYVSLCTNQSIAAILPNDTYNSLYLYYVIDSLYDYLRLLSSGDGGRGGLNKKLLNALYIRFPHSKSEQTAIAEALSDVDALIAGLDKKIEKKRLIKQGAMQQLLAGKKRLAGFSEPWITKQIGDIAILYQPITIAQDQFTMQGYNVYGANGIIGKYSHYNHSTDQVLITCRGSSCGTVNYSKGYCWITGNAMVINMDGNKDVNKQFIYYLLSNNDLSELITGSGQPQIVRKVLSEYSIKIPSDYAEQYAIASILSDMDKEIADLEARRDKYTQIKSGMMQKLLTGQIRLIHKRQARIIPLDAHIVAGHIVNKLHESRGWGRTKLQKSLHLIGYHCQLDLGNEYIRNTAGPDDQKLMSYIDQKFLNYGQVRKVEFRDSAGRKHYNYLPTAKIDEIEFAFEQYPADIRNRINGLLAKIERMDLGRAEIISTLYAVWNNRLIKHEPISDDLLLADFYAWSDHKADFSRDLVLRGLDYMRQEGIIPTGWGQYIDKK